jgi:hypothetical protein
MSKCNFELEKLRCDTQSENRCFCADCPIIALHVIYKLDPDSIAGRLHENAHMCNRVIFYYKKGLELAIKEIENG